MKVLIVFGSLLGKTQRIAGLIGVQLKEKRIDASVKNVLDVKVADLYIYDVVVLGCSTWDDGVLQHDFRPFHHELLQVKFPGKKFAVFALGSHKYPHPITAASILEATVHAMHGELVVPPLKLDLDHDDPEDLRDDEVTKWVRLLNVAIS